jgi:DNA polymerase delta subunit 3
MEDDEEPPVKMAKIENQAESPDISTGAVAGVITSGGRVRGKRKVQRKIQSQDSDGYLGLSSFSFA